MTAAPKQLSIQSFGLGMNERLPDFRLRTKEGYFVRRSANADITAAGSMRRRAGYASQISGVASHSLWSGAEDSFYADQNALIRLTDGPIGLQAATVYTGLRTGAPVSYTDAPDGSVYWTDGLALMRALGDTTDAVAPARPDAPPLVGIGSGSLPVGTYRYCFTYTTVDGRESPATHPEQIELTTPGALEFTVAAAPPAGLTLNAFVSPTNGVEMYLVATMTVGTTRHAFPFEGRRCHTVGLECLPAGRFVRISNGRTFVALGSTLFYSEPYSTGLYDPVRGYVALPEPITVMEPVDGEQPGMYVVADHTYWLADAFPDTELRMVLPYGAAEGSSVTRDDNTDVHWMSTRGLVTGSTGGQIKNLQESNVAVQPAARAVTVIREANGEQHAVSSMFGGATLQRAAASSYMEAEIVSGA